MASGKQEANRPFPSEQRVWNAWNCWQQALRTTEGCPRRDPLSPLPGLPRPLTDQVQGRSFETACVLLALAPAPQAQRGTEAQHCMAPGRCPSPEQGLQPSRQRAPSGGSVQALSRPQLNTLAPHPWGLWETRDKHF